VAKVLTFPSFNVLRLFLDLRHLLVSVGTRLPSLSDALLWLARAFVMSMVVFAVSMVMLSWTATPLTTGSASRSSCAVVNLGV
jgi:hypothetical protein